MLRLEPILQHYAWGSPAAIPELLGVANDGRPVAEAWFGAHPLGASRAFDTRGLSSSLAAAIANDPASALGCDIVARFGPALPYLLKVLAADRPLSLQVHPSLDQARAGFEAENRAGVPLDSPNRNYKDANHKPELVYALTRVEALCGFRAPRRAAELFGDLDSPLAARVSAILGASLDAGGVRAAFESLLQGAGGPSAADIESFVSACRRRLARGSTSPRADRIVLTLAAAYPGDPGVAASLLLNPVSLRPGEALFIPAGGVHSYQSGVMIEIMASSDNVLRAGLTPKHIDVPALLDCVDYVAAPPMRIAPEQFGSSSRVFYAPVDDFELSVTDLEPSEERELPGRGPRILLALGGEARLNAADDGLVLRHGQAAFVGASEGPLTARGAGTLVQADAP